jgi:hypothetical protein
LTQKISFQNDLTLKAHANTVHLKKIYVNSVKNICLVEDAYLQMLKTLKNLSKLKDCVLCFEILKKSCRSCFYPLDPNQQIKNPSCKIHFYCKECFLTFPADLKCSECQNFYMHPSQNKCLSCKISCSFISPHHDDHFLCSICTNFFNNSSKETLDIILKKITCQKCVQTFRNKGKPRTTKSLQCEFFHQSTNIIWQ